MVWTYLPLGTLPWIDDIVWCRFPMGGNPNIPGGEHHPVLVLARRINIQDRRGGLTVAYGTSTTKEAERGTLDLIITADEIAAHGLRYPTRFDLADVNRIHPPWCSEFFSTPRSQPNIHIGSLGDGAKTRLTDLLCWRAENGRTD